MIEEVVIESAVMSPIDADTELIPPAGSDGVGVAVTEMMNQILDYREDMKFAERCVRFYKYRKAEHWNTKNKDLNLLSVNLLGSHHQKTVNMLTDNNPTFNAVPGGDLGDSAQEQLSLLENVTDSWWIDTEQQNVFEESVHVGELYGTVGEHVYFDVSVNFPYGEVVTETLDPLYVSLYPPKCRKIEKAEAVLRWYPMSVREAKRRWPEVADQLKGDLSLIEEIGDDRHDETTEGRKSWTVLISSITKWVSQSEKRPQEHDADELFIIECWVKDYSQAGGKPVYPGNIRRVRVTNGGKVVLDDDYNPTLNPELPPDVHQSTYLYSRFPFSYIQPVIDPASPFGISDFEQLEKLNVEFNKTMTQFTLFKDKTSRPKLLNPKDSGVTNDELNNMVGIARPTNYMVGQAIRYIDPPQMSADIISGLNLYKDLFNEVAGSFNDVMQGRKQGSEVIAAKAIAMLLEEASRMARGKIRNYSKMLRERGRMFVALAQNWYDTPRFVKFQNGGEEQVRPVTRNELQISGKINIVSGSTMPVSNIQRREEVLSLLQAGVVDQEYVLEKFNVDNYKDIIKRMQQGPLGQYLQKLSMIGIPQPLLQLFQQIGQMDEKQIQQALETGQIPQFGQLLQQLAGQTQPEQPNPEAVKNQIEGRKVQIQEQKTQTDAMLNQARIQIDSQKAQAEIAKVQAEIELIKQRIETEIVERQVKAAGVELDRENIRIQKAQAVAGIQAQENVHKVDKIKTAASLMRQKEGSEVQRQEMRQDKGGYDERGMKSNNEQ